MRRAVDTGLSRETAPCSHAVVAKGILITRLEDKSAIDEVYARYFRRPYPSRACIVVSALAVPGTRIEVLAYASLPA